MKPWVIAIVIIVIFGAIGYMWYANQSGSGTDTNTPAATAPTDNGLGGSAPGDGSGQPQSDTTSGAPTDNGAGAPPAGAPTDNTGGTQPSAPSNAPAQQ